FSFEDFKSAIRSSSAFARASADALSAKQEFSLTVAVFKRSCVSFCLASKAAYSFLETQDPKRNKAYTPNINVFFIMISVFCCYYLTYQNYTKDGEFAW